MHYPHSPHRSEYFTVYRDGPWKVIYHYFPSPASENSHYQLFHLANDPFEQTNLAPSHPDELRRMMGSLIAALERHHAVYPVDKDGTTPVKPRCREGEGQPAKRIPLRRKPTRSHETPRPALPDRLERPCSALAPPLSAADGHGDVPTSCSSFPTT